VKLTTLLSPVPRDFTFTPHPMCLHGAVLGHRDVFV
jgi:hypothetical protein